MDDSHRREASPPQLGSAPGEATRLRSLFPAVTPSTEKWGEIQLESSVTFQPRKGTSERPTPTPFSVTDRLVKDLDSKPTLPHLDFKRPWLNHSPFLSLTFSVYKVGIRPHKSFYHSERRGHM